MENAKIEEIELENKYAKKLFENENKIYKFFEDNLFGALFYDSSLRKYTIEKDYWYFLNDLKAFIKFLKKQIKAFRDRNGDSPRYGYSLDFYQKIKDIATLSKILEYERDEKYIPHSHYCVWCNEDNTR